MSALFDSEEIRFGSGFPSLIRFYKGDPEKPLIVFFPGWASLGRISYGYPGGNDKHFLAHWILKKGYSFLATSYPMGHPVYKDVYPDFNLTDWGDMVADIVDQIISENGLTKNIINIHWSAAGQAIRPFNVACMKRALNVLFALGIEASPALQLPSDRREGIKTNKNKLLNLKNSHYELFWKQVEEQNVLNSEQILTTKQFEKYFFGDIPAAIGGSNTFYENGSLVDDIPKGFKDKGFFSFTEYPIVAVISGNSSLSPYHPIVDRTTWSFLNTRKLYHGMIVSFEHSGMKITEKNVAELIRYINGLPRALSTVVPGTHFLFIGKKGAQKVAGHIEKFESKIRKINDDISGILSS